MTITAPVLSPAESIAGPSAFWGGRWRRTATTAQIRDPEDGTVVGEAAVCSPQDADDAVQGLRAALRTEPWPAWQRRDALSRAAALLAERSEPLARLMSSEGSKTHAEARRETARAAETMRLCAEEAGRLGGETLPLDASPRGAGRVGWWTREPVGVVAAVTPFNDPLNLVVHKLGPALAAGNAVAVKPADATPLTAAALFAVLLDAGVPPGRLALLPGPGPTTGAALVSHDDVALVSFTGGWRTGLDVARAAAGKRVVMELGGNCPVLVLDDADVVAAASSIVAGAFGAAGQNCVSVQRVYASDRIADDLASAVADGASRLVVGPKASLATDVGPLIDEAAAVRVQEWVDEAVARGATALCGGQRNGAYYPPTVLVDVPADARVAVEEVFGPVVSVFAVRDDDDAVDAANASSYGLQAGVFSGDTGRALAAAARLDVGGVMVNDSSDFRIDAMPFGGRGRSGVGREGVRSSIEAMTEPKVCVVSLPAPAAPTRKP